MDTVFGTLSGMTDFHSTFSNSTQAESIPRQGIKLGANPGELMAALPAMMGFVPNESLVLIGIVPDSVEPHRLRIGPVIRLDLERWAMCSAIEEFTDALREWDSPQALVYGIHPDRDAVEDFIDDAALFLEDGDVSVISTWWIEGIHEGAAWLDLESLETGRVASTDDNPLNNLTSLNGALSLKDRRELEQWLAKKDDAPVLRPRRFVDSTEDRAECSKLLEDLLTVTLATMNIHQGHVLLEDAMANRHLLRAVCCIARDERLSPYLIALALGDRAPIVRELLVEAARHSRTHTRRRLLLILSAVLSNNDEGMPAFYALREVMLECQAIWFTNDVDQLNKLIVEHMWHRHMTGTSKSSNFALAANGLYWVANWDMTNDNPDECSESAPAHDVVEQAEKRKRHRVLLDLLEQAIDWNVMRDEQNGLCHPGHW